MPIKAILFIAAVFALALYVTISDAEYRKAQRATGPKFVCESSQPDANCVNRYGIRSGTYARIYTAYRGNPRYVGIQGELK